MLGLAETYAVFNSVYAIFQAIEAAMYTGLAYRSGEAWNEAGFANEEFDRLLAEANSIADADKRRTVMGKLQAIMIDEGVTIQPYWRTVTRHHKDTLVGVDMHIAYLPQIYKWAFKA